MKSLCSCLGKSPSREPKNVPKKKGENGPNSSKWSGGSRSGSRRDEDYLVSVLKRPSADARAKAQAEVEGPDGSISPLLSGEREAAMPLLDSPDVTGSESASERRNSSGVKNGRKRSEDRKEKVVVGVASSAISGGGKDAEESVPLISRDEDLPDHVTNPSDTADPADVDPITDHPGERGNAAFVAALPVDGSTDAGCTLPPVAVEEVCVEHVEQASPPPTTTVVGVVSGEMRTTVCSANMADTDAVGSSPTSPRETQSSAVVARRGGSNAIASPTTTSPLLPDPPVTISIICAPPLDDNASSTPTEDRPCDVTTSPVGDDPGVQGWGMKSADRNDKGGTSSDKEPVGTTGVDTCHYGADMSSLSNGNSSHGATPEQPLISPTEDPIDLFHNVELLDSTQKPLSRSHQKQDLCKTDESAVSDLTSNQKVGEGSTEITNDTTQVQNHVRSTSLSDATTPSTPDPNSPMTSPSDVTHTTTTPPAHPPPQHRRPCCNDADDSANSDTDEDDDDDDDDDVEALQRGIERRLRAAGGTARPPRKQVTGRRRVRSPLHANERLLSINEDEDDDVIPKVDVTRGEKRDAHHRSSSSPKNSPTVRQPKRSALWARRRKGKAIRHRT